MSAFKERIVVRSTDNVDESRTNNGGIERGWWKKWKYVSKYVRNCVSRTCFHPPLLRPSGYLPIDFIPTPPRLLPSPTLFQTGKHLVSIFFYHYGYFKQLLIFSRLHLGYWSLFLVFGECILRKLLSNFQQIR